MAVNLLHLFADSIHHFFVEQPVLQILDQIDQVDRWVLENHQQAEEALLDFSQPAGWEGPDFLDFSN
ncbi:MAG: hypothetical protein ROW48_18140 [Bellilinea sp.]|jgi:hypothetical protein